MASNDPPRFEDSEDEEDFNPAPADLSDDERGDDDDGDQDDQRRSSPAKSPPAAQDDEDEDDEPPRTKSRRTDDDEQDEDDEDEEEDDAGRARDDDDDDEDEEEEDEDEDVQQGHRRKRRKDRRNAFFDIEAEVDDEDEGEDEEKEGEEIEDFIDNAHPDDVVDQGRLDDDRRHRELDRRREMEASMDAEKQAEILRQRYGNRRSAKNFGDSAVVPKRLLLPSVDDPSIWAVRCKEGKEREVVFSIMKRMEERMGRSDELAITAAFERGGAESVMKGWVYVEAQRMNDVLIALDSMLNVYPRSKIVLMEIKEMPELLRVTKTPMLEQGAYVRLTRPPRYKGDLAQVLDVTENGLEARVRYIPRVDYTAKDDANKVTNDGGKRKRAAIRPPQRMFSEVEARKHAPRYLAGNPTTQSWTFMGEDFENGYVVRDVKIQQLSVTDVNASLEEVAKFASGAEDGSESLDLKALAASMKISNALVTYLPGDIIEVYSGEQKGVVGRATDVRGDIVTIAVSEGDLAGQTIEVPTKGLRKRFRVGDHVKVIGGSKFRDEVGTVVAIQDDRVTLLTDQTHTEVTVFSRDLREASDIGGQGSLGQYELQDLVQLDQTTVGCVVKVDRESLVVLDQNGDTRTVMPSQISNKIPKRKQTVAADRNGAEIRIEDVVKEAGGQQRQGKIIHIHRTFVFLHTNDTTENAGVFVTKSSMVNTIAAKGGRISQATGPDLNAMNPALRRNPENKAQQPPPMQKFGKDRAIGMTVIIKKGAYKGLLGIVKDTNDKFARVELHTKSKIVTVEKAFLNFKDKSGNTVDINSRGRAPPGMGRPGDSRVPSWQAGSRTPMGAGGNDRVPAWGSRTPGGGGRTPAWKSGDLSGSRTPAWADGSRTVNPYDGSRTAYGANTGSRTPAWQSGARTPHLGDAFGAGSRTPAYSGSGGDSWNSGSKTPAWGASAASVPTPGASGGGEGWGYTPSSYDAATPADGAAAPTPGALNAPTPGGYNAPTPATPAGSWQGGWGADGAESAPTPAALTAPTPGASGGYYGAPTPGGFGETPGASGPTYAEDDDD